MSAIDIESIVLGAAGDAARDALQVTKERIWRATPALIERLCDER